MKKILIIILLAFLTVVLAHTVSSAQWASYTFADSDNKFIGSITEGEFYKDGQIKVNGRAFLKIVISRTTVNFSIFEYELKPNNEIHYVDYRGNPRMMLISLLGSNDEFHITYRLEPYTNLKVIDTGDKLLVSILFKESSKVLIKIYIPDTERYYSFNVSSYLFKEKYDNYLYWW